MNMIQKARQYPSLYYIRQKKQSCTERFSCIIEFSIEFCGILFPVNFLLCRRDARGTLCLSNFVFFDMRISRASQETSMQRCNYGRYRKGVVIFI